MPQIKSSFVLNSPQPLDLRDSLTQAEMKSKGRNDVDAGHITYCKDGDDAYKGRYFIFNPNVEYDDKKLGYYREFSLNETVIVSSHKDLREYNAASFDTGKMIYCMDDKLMYYNRYYPGATDTDDTVWNSETGFFWQLVDLASSNYVSTTSEVWKQLILDVDKLNNNEIKVFNRVQDLIDEIDVYETWPYSKGQIVYCKEINSHLYNAYTQDDISKSPNKENLKGWFGYFKLLDKSIQEPDVKEPKLIIYPYKEKDYDGIWKQAKKNGQDILVADINKFNFLDQTTKPNIGPIEYVFDKGEIDYSKYTYFPEEYNSKTFQYVTGENILSGPLSYPNGDALSTEVGDRVCYLPWNINSEEHKLSPYKDKDGIDLKGRITLVKSNNIIFNYTKPIWASTSSSDLVEQDLIPWDDNMEAEFKLVCTAQNPQTIKVPRPLQKLYVKFLDNYIEEDINDWSESRDGDYYIYTYKTSTNGHRGEVYVKIKF